MNKYGDLLMRDVSPIIMAISGGTVAYKAPLLESPTEVATAIFTWPLILQIIGACVGLLGVIVAAFRGYVAWKEYLLKEAQHNAKANNVQDANRGREKED